VIEVDRPNRQARRRSGESDVVDAIEAGRAALSGRARGLAKTADGNAEAIRALLIAKRSARDTRIKCLNQIRHLGFTAPDELRERLRGVPRGSLARTAAGFRPARTPDVVTAATKLALSTLGRRVLDLEATTKCLDDRLAVLVRATAPGLLALDGVGVDTAAIVLVTAGDNPHRLRNEAVRAPLRCRPDRSVFGQDRASPSQPRWEPSSQPCAVAHRVHPHGHRRPHPRLRRPASRARTNQTRDQRLSR
jgi:transposase